LSDLLLEKIICLLVLNHLLLPGRLLKVLIDFEEILKVVKGEDPETLIDDKKGKKAELHVDIGSKSNFSSIMRYWGVLHYVKLILELY
jgi:hypothetical protein